MDFGNRKDIALFNCWVFKTECSQKDPAAVTVASKDDVHPARGNSAESRAYLSGPGERNNETMGLISAVVRRHSSLIRAEEFSISLSMPLPPRLGSRSPATGDLSCGEVIPSCPSAPQIFDSVFLISANLFKNP